MKFALVCGKRTEATNGAKGICPSCGSELVAKCGKIKINHWAHKRISNCDIWWENETEWHRAWKNNFPAEWQEIVLRNERNGEKHIADIRTIHGLVIEFQHSRIDPKERTLREEFYQNMVWVVNGSRLKRDYHRFLKAKKEFQIVKEGIFYIDFPDECFPSAWIGSSVPVIFDYQKSKSIEDRNDIREQLYCLFPIRIGRYAVLAEIPRKTFINTTINGEWLMRALNYMKNLNQAKQEWQNQIKKRQQLQANINLLKSYRYGQGKRRNIRL